MNFKLASRAGFAVAVFALITLAFRESILAQVLAVFLMVWARVTFGRRSFHASADPTEGGVVTSGPYHYLRHPIYAAVIYFLWAGILCHISVLNLFLGFLATIGLFVRIIAEERLVTERYPDYAAYASRTKRVIPFVV